MAPVYRLECDRGVRRRIELERGFAYLCPITALDSDDERLWVADLRLLIPVEKGWLVSATTANGFVDESGYERLARQLARLFSRPAYPTSIVRQLLAPLSDLLGEIAERNEGRDPIVEVGLALGRSRFDPATAQIVFMLDGPLDDELRERVLRWGEERLDDPPESISVLLPRIVDLDELTAREYRLLDIVDIAAFSPTEDPQLQVQPGAEPSTSTDVDN